jgi:hypothetical protein
VGIHADFIYLKVIHAREDFFICRTSWVADFKLGIIEGKRIIDKYLESGAIT